MNVAGIDGHARYVVVTVLSSRAKMLHRPVRIKNAEAHAKKLRAIAEANYKRDESLPPKRRFDA